MADFVRSPNEHRLSEEFLKIYISFGNGVRIYGSWGSVGLFSTIGLNYSVRKPFSRSFLSNKSCQSRKDAMLVLYDEGAPSNHGFTPKYPRFWVYLALPYLHFSSNSKISYHLRSTSSRMRMLSDLIYPFACSFRLHTSPRNRRCEKDPINEWKIIF